MSAAPNRPQKVTISYSFPKEERLCSKKLITELFSKGSSFNLYPLRFVFIKNAQPVAAPPQVLVSVSKKYFKKAVDRNRLKRQMREAYRLSRHLLQVNNQYPLQLLAIIYIGKEKSPFNLIQKKLNLGLERSVIE
ncbi:ribonuclease P protein component [Adhaeribacter aerolatus]|uniref:Ribonuclease P protein component n=2 Tax=Adhaeribacter aerolatus TaxID=670289 RepID=A0A512AVL7_9BACT|nr:ribonuclease P protein component [Adhaeribacter aerolatus]